MNYGSAGGLHDTATYLTLKMDIVLLLKGLLDLEEPIVKTDNSDIVFWKRIFSQRELIFSQNHHIIGRKKESL